MRIYLLKQQMILIQYIYITSNLNCVYALIVLLLGLMINVQKSYYNATKSIVSFYFLESNQDSSFEMIKHCNIHEFAAYLSQILFNVINSFTIL